MVSAIRSPLFLHKRVALLAKSPHHLAANSSVYSQELPIFSSRGLRGPYGWSRRSDRLYFFISELLSWQKVHIIWQPTPRYILRNYQSSPRADCEGPTDGLGDLIRGAVIYSSVIVAQSVLK